MIFLSSILFITWVMSITGLLFNNPLDFSYFIFSDQPVNFMFIVFLSAIIIPMVLVFVSFLYSINLIYRFGSKYINFLLLHGLFIFILIFSNFFGGYALQTRFILPILIFFIYIRIGIYMIYFKGKIINDFNQTNMVETL